MQLSDGSYRSQLDGLGGLSADSKRVGLIDIDSTPTPASQSNVNRARKAAWSATVPTTIVVDGSEDTIGVPNREPISSVAARGGRPLSPIS
jgi:hypothetical protein